MSCFTLLKLLNVCKWILIFIFILVIDTCYVKGWYVAHQIFAYKEDGFTTSIMFISHVVCLSLCCLLFVIVFLFSTCSFLAYCLGFCFFLQQSIYITFISCVVGFALSCCLLLSSCSLLVHFLHYCLDF
jgi:hypothetical protein